MAIDFTAISCVSQYSLFIGLEDVNDPSWGAEISFVGPLDLFLFSG